MPASRILVIDDEDGLRRAIKSVLEWAGYEVREARNGTEALRLWREQECDLVITDIHMPGKGGIETILELRTLSPGLPLIAASGSGERTCLDLLHEAGVSGTIRTLDKPFRINDVLAMVKEMLDGAARRQD
jgi:CheY-like chemotaxis protein